MLEKPYKFYRENLYQKYEKVRETRGMTFLLRNLLRFAEIGFPKSDTEPESVFREDWDNLIVLDACRHDLYEEVNGETDHRITLGSRTMEFLEKNFFIKIL